MMHVEANSRGLRRGFETVRNRNTSGLEACVAVVVVDVVCVVIIEICAFLGFLERRLAVSYRRFGTKYYPHLQKQSSPSCYCCCFYYHCKHCHNHLRENTCIECWRRGCGLDWINLAQDREEWQAVVNTAMTRLVHKMRGIS